MTGEALNPRPKPKGSTLNELPHGVLRSRVSAMRNERVETAKTITVLEKVAVDAQNRVIRMRSILLEVTRSNSHGAKWAAIQEALETSE